MKVLCHPKLRPLMSCFIVCAVMTARYSAANAPAGESRLRVAALEFGVTPEANAATGSRTGARAGTVVGPLHTTIVLLDDGATRLCLVTTHFAGTTALNVSDLVRNTIAQDLNLPTANVLIFSSHNHSSATLATNGVSAYATYAKAAPPADLSDTGERLLKELRRHAARLPDLLQPVTVWWAEGHEDRITYNRKGRRADGSTYFMREEDRVLIAEDFRGDVDTQAPIVVLKNKAGEAVAALTQFTGHPVTSYHPENPVVFGDWPQVACDVVRKHLDDTERLPIAFLQGCAGDVNSKEMFCGGVERATEFGRMLGQSYIDALATLQPSRRSGLDYGLEKVSIPLAPLPPEQMLVDELKEMDDFILRANAGDENTLSCVGLNFPRALTPAYRARLVELVRQWNRWALELYEHGKSNSVEKHLDLEIAVIRIGDVGIVGMCGEAFQGIGRQIRNKTPLPIAIPCAYMNGSHGYITDGPNTGDREYMSAFYRYTRFRPPLMKPAGDVMADKASDILGRFARDAALRDVITTNNRN